MYLHFISLYYSRSVVEFIRFYCSKKLISARLQILSLLSYRVKSTKDSGNALVFTAFMREINTEHFLSTLLPILLPTPPYPTHIPTHMCKSIPAVSIPQALEKMVKCPELRAIFVGKCPTPRSYYDCQMLGPPVHPTNIQKY